jgi:CspA family cold shock protein
MADQPSDNLERAVRGKVKWFSDPKGFGFITNTTGEDVFVHHSEIVGSGFKTLVDGEEVVFDQEKRPKGPIARNIHRVNPPKDGTPKRTPAAQTQTRNIPTPGPVGTIRRGLVGVVKWFDKKKGYGFLVGPDGWKVFVHHESIVGDGLEKLNEREEVGFDEEVTDKGPTASNVTRSLPSKILSAAEFKAWPNRQNEGSR